MRIDSDESEWRKPCDDRTIGVDGAGTGITAICPQKLTTGRVMEELDILLPITLTNICTFWGSITKKVLKISRLFTVSGILSRIWQKE